MMRRILRGLIRLLWGFRAYDTEVLNTPGPVLLVPNHVSWLDWLFLFICLDDDWKCVVSSASAETSWIHRKIMINRRTFPIDTNSPYAVKRMAEFLGANGRLVLFAEGRLSRTGTLMKIFDGTGFLLHKTHAKVITCYIRGAHRLPFSPNRDQHFLFPRVSIHFSSIHHPPKLEHLTTAQSRAAFTNWLRDRMVEQQFATEMKLGPPTIPEAIVKSARLRPGHIALLDVTGQLKYRRLLVGADLLARQFDGVLSSAQKRIGVLLPNFNVTPVVLMALWETGRAPSVLNYSHGTSTMLACCALAGLEHIVTSRAFIERTKLKLEPFQEAGLQFIYVEDLRARIGVADKLRASLRARWTPRSAIRNPPSPDDTAVVLFTSGSEGTPKGVELTHQNILANIRQMLAVCDLQDWDRFFTALPLFHSFGLAVGTLLPLVRGCSVLLYPSPLHYRVVPTMFYAGDCTILLATNTFLNGYARKAHAQDFRGLRYLFEAAEKLQDATATAWAQRFNVCVLEGYGATECSPCVSVNTPLAPKYGTAGRLLPGMEYRLEPVEGVVDAGRLFVRGPNVMRGYLNPDANAKFIALGGWYDTGDIAKVDEDRFVSIQGRLKRFAKVSGEMVSLSAVEDALAGAFPQYGLRCQVAVISRPDAEKGEMLIAATNESKMSIDEVRAAIRARGLPNICAPREVRFVKEIPKLGTGKVNHRELEKVL
ncbi:MAG: acyl-[acyl-carrier-protein]-phospholipid O-acyltransferase [Verrucomicrobiota bacterium]|jgi:acyl-[acyl-carrier-protein]-phospholipid O-acyltransferase/long-chain-fatty-acid--[acyl-carrier-protein] ligase